MTLRRVCCPDSECPFHNETLFYSLGLPLPDLRPWATSNRTRLLWSSALTVPVGPPLARPHLMGGEKHGSEAPGVKAGVPPRKGMPSGEQTPADWQVKA